MCCPQKKLCDTPDPIARQVVKLLEKSLQLNDGHGVFNDTVVQVQQLLWVPWQPGPRISKGEKSDQLK